MKFIERLLEERPTTSPGPELEPDDLRLEAATTASVRGEFLQAAQIAEEVFSSGVYDARLFGYLLLGTLMERGPSSLPLVLRAMTCAVMEQRHAFTPLRRREVLLDGVLHWFLTQLVRQLELSSKLGDGQQQAWEQALRAGELDQVFELSEPLHRILTELTPRAKSPPPLLRLIDLLRQMHQPVVVQHTKNTERSPDHNIPRVAQPSSTPVALPTHPPLANSELESGSATSSSAQAEVCKESERVMQTPWPTTSEVQRPGVVSSGTMDVSEPLKLLATNMERFELLLNQGNHLMAAVIGAELQRELQRFDPILYLPKLVAPFLRQLAASCDELEPYFARSDSLRFQTLTKFFRADPDGFVNAAVPKAGDGLRETDTE